MSALVLAGALLVIAHPARAETEEAAAPPGPQAPAGFQTVKPQSGLFSLSLPAEWKVAPALNGDGLSAQSPDGKVELLCADDHGKSTLGAFANETAELATGLMGMTEVSRSTVRISGHPGLRLEFSGNQRLWIDYFVVTAGDRLMLTLSCPEADKQALEPVLTKVAESWQINAGPPAPVPPPQPVLPQPQPPWQPELIAPQPLPAPRPWPASQPQPTPPVRLFQTGLPQTTRQIPDPGGVFTIGVPADWPVSQSVGGAMAMHPTQRATMAVVTASRQAASLEQFTQSMLGVWPQQLPNWRQVGTQSFQISGRPAVCIRATGTPNGIPIVADYFLVLTDDRQILLVLSCYLQDLPQRQATFQQIVQSFQVR